MVARARRTPAVARGLRRAPQGDRVLGPALARAHVDWLIRGGAGPHGTKRMVGPPPRANGKPLDPVNEWGHDMLWWLDKMVRSQRPLQEKLTLFWHDHFATRDQDAPLHAGPEPQAAPARARPLPELLRAVTTDPAMQAFLSLVDSDKRDPERELRPRADGALHARGHRRLHRARRPRGRSVR
jgi:hypothetical protein